MGMECCRNERVRLKRVDQMPPGKRACSRDTHIEPTREADGDPGATSSSSRRGIRGTCAGRLAPCAGNGAGRHGIFVVTCIGFGPFHNRASDTAAAGISVRPRRAILEVVSLLSTTLTNHHTPPHPERRIMLRHTLARRLISPWRSIGEIGGNDGRAGV